MEDRERCRMTRGDLDMVDEEGDGPSVAPLSLSPLP
jgi:hypothetical protein